MFPGLKRQERRRRGFGRICRMLVDGKEFRRCGHDFRELCATSKVGYVGADNMMYEQVGMSGDEVISMLRCRKPQI